MRIMISHAVEDAAIAAVLRELLERCSLGRVEVWFSSDRTEGGGMTVGSTWFSDLHTRLKSSQAVLCLVTPNSLRSPWMYYETGVIAGGDAKLVVPAAFGLTLDQLPMPLAAYHGVEIGMTDGLREFLAKLLSHAGVKFDEELTQGLRESALKAILETKTTVSRVASDSDPLRDALSSLESKLERRFYEVMRALPRSTTTPIQYSVDFRIRREHEVYDRFKLTVSSDQTVAQSLDDLWRFTKSHVPAYTYLERWLVRNLSTGRRLIVRDIGHLFPAEAFFVPGDMFEIELLGSPYDPREDSGIPHDTIDDYDNPSVGR